MHIERENIHSKVEALKMANPEGVFVYFQPNTTQHTRLQAVFKSIMPKKLVITTDYDFGGIFPADWGTQLGNRFYGLNGLYTLVRRGIFSSLGINFNSQEEYNAFDKEHLHLINPHLPQVHQYSLQEPVNALEGGYIVPIANSKTWVFGYREPFSAAELQLLRQHGITSRYTHTVYKALKALHRQSSHTDLVLTGLRTPLGITGYLDEVLLNKLLELGDDLSWFPGTLKPYPHELARKGGLNIKYIGQHALVLSEKTAAPLMEDFHQANLTPVFLGTSQFEAEGGIKCRSAELTWRR